MDATKWIYWGDPKMWGLTAFQRRALQVGQITPREARELYDLRVAQARPFWHRLVNQETKCHA